MKLTFNLFIQLIPLFFFLENAFSNSEKLLTENEKLKEVTLEIDSLDDPIELSGKWLFTRDDKKENSKNSVDISSWKVAQLPGSWEKVYDDKKLYRIAWHKRIFSFNEKLIGKKVNIYSVTFWPNFDLYLDGKLINSQTTHEVRKGFSNTRGMSLIATFKITKKSHTLTFRFKSLIMKSFHLKPFQLREYKEFDLFINVWDFLLTDILKIGGSAAFMAGLLFLFVFLKTKESFYKIPSFMGICCGLSFMAWAGLFNRFIGFNGSLSLFYGTLIPSAIYVTFFVKQYIYIKWYWLTPSFVCGLCSFLFLFVINPEDHFEMFLNLRKLGFSMAIPNQIILIILMLKNRRPFGSDFWLLLFAQISVSFSSWYSVLGALDIIEGYAVVQLGFMILIFVVLYLSAKNFAKTYLDNQKNLKEVTNLKDNLEEKVKEKTLALELEMESTEIMMEQIYNQKKKRDLLLGSLSEGFLTINKDGIIEEGATRVSQDLLEVNLTESEVEKIQIWDVLFKGGEKRDIFKKWVEKVFESKFSFRDLKGLAPKKFEGTKGKHIELEFRPIYEKESKRKVDKLVIIASDKTKEVQLEEQLNRDKENIEFINKCLQNPLEFVDLMYDTQTLIHDFYFSFKGEKEFLFRGFHTLKARFGLFGLKKIADLINDIETAISKEEVGNIKRSIKLLDEKLINFMKTNRIIVEAANKALIEEGSAVQVSEVLKRAEQFNVATDYIDYIKREYLYSDIKLKFERYISLVNELAQRQDKSIEVKILGEEILVDTNKYSKFINSSIHIFRNMVDHGIEPEDERIEKTKPQRGKIKLLFKKNERNFEIEIKDDGQGINLDKLKKKAIDNGLKSKVEISNFDKQEILDLIFLPGFSTKEDVTDISGRGVGMDAVKKEVIGLNGDIQVSSKMNEGTTFVITLPIIK